MSRDQRLAYIADMMEFWDVEFWDEKNISGRREEAALARGRAEGEAKGRAEGRAEGEAKGRAEGEAKGRTDAAAFCKHRRHDGVFRRGYRHFVEKDIGAFERVRIKHEFTVYVYACAEFGKREKVRVEPSPADNVSARRQHFRSSRSSEEGK